MQAADEVVDITEAPRLLAFAVYGDRLVLERLSDEIRHNTAVLHAHARAIRVEDPHEARVQLVRAVIGHRYRLGEALRLVVDAARADRIDIDPIVLALRFDERVAVDFG